MFADGIMESSNTEGTSDYVLTGPEFNGFPFSSEFSDGDEVCFIAQTLDGSKKEIILGTYEIGPPKKLLRTTVLLSSQGGAKIDWQPEDVYYIASFPSATVIAGLIKQNLASSRPWWLQFGMWFKQDFPSANLHTLYINDGTNDIEVGTLDAGANSFLLKALSTAGVMDFLATPSSANLKALLTDETGSGAVVFGTSPTIASPTFLGNVATPDKTQTSNDGYAVNSKYVDRVAVQQIVQSTDTGYRTTSGTALPADNSIPQNTEGDEYTELNTNITPKSATSILMIEVEVVASRANSDTLVLALFKDAAVGAISARAIFTPSGNTPTLLRVCHRMVAGSTSAISFKARIGSNTANALYLNGISSGGLLGGVEQSFMRITEYGV